MPSRSVVRASILLVIALAAAAVGIPAQAAPLPPRAPTLEIEQKYFAAGPFAVSMVMGSENGKFDLWYPTDLGRDGLKHPIVTWGNGTDGVPTQYAFLLDHLASWGFVVVASTEPRTASGQAILDAARWMAGQNGASGSIFRGKLAPKRVGAMGHSQGAAGVLNAMEKSNGLITTAIPIELPSQVYCGNEQVNCPDPSRLTGGSFFLVNGSADVVISPSRQVAPASLVGLQSNAAYYEAAPASVTKVWATLNGADHNDVQGQPGCAPGAIGCLSGVHGYLGYPTAWMLDQLRGDKYAHQAFVNGTGELFRETTNWSNQTSNIAPST